MDKEEVRALLAIHRSGEGDLDARFEAALKAASADPELARWWAEEQEMDRLIGAKLQHGPIPQMLRAQLTTEIAKTPSNIIRPTWQRAALLAAACLVAMAVLFSSRRGAFQPAVALADYREEMVSFVKVTPSLELESNKLPKLTDFLAKRDAPSAFKVPNKLQAMEPVGCRVLRFRGHDVSLICFNAAQGDLVHLFVMDGTSLAGITGKGAAQFVAQGKWMTASWTEDGHTYLVAVQGDRAKAESFVSTS